MIRYKCISFPPLDGQLIIRPCTEENIDIGDYETMTSPMWKKDFTGKCSESLLLYLEKSNQRLVLLGIGKSNQIQSANTGVRKYFIDHQTKWNTPVNLDVRGLDDEVLYQVVLGMQLAQYNPGHFKSPKSNGKKGMDQLNILADQSEDRIKKIVNESLATGETICRVMKLVDLPSNQKTPSQIARWVQDSAGEYNYKVEILSARDLGNLGCHALLAVGKGSSEPSLMLNIEYKPENSKSQKPHIGLVGKGITFDTGGISIKPSSKMHMMKSDMGGAAAVIGAIELAARLKLDIHLAAMIPLAENSVDANSVKPGDVIRSHSGKTIEIINTDAEGRLILADALSYMIDVYNPEHLIDLATLTGSSVRTFGYEAAALFSNSDTLKKLLYKASSNCSERIWSMPLWEEYGKDLESDIADIRNLSGKPVAGAIAAAKFLEYFIKDHKSWAHLDIAGVAFTDTKWTKDRGATGYGVRLLVEMFKESLK